jgi:dipeptidyl aminopeptidase/acylaminoacyl peptidase
VRALSVTVATGVLGLLALPAPVVALRSRDRDLACPADRPPRAALVYVHPGAFLFGAADADLRRFCAPFARRGYETVAVDYPTRDPADTAGAFSFERALRHVRRAVQHASRAGLPVVAYGESVGGTLVERLAVRGSVDAAVAVAAPSDLLSWASGNRDYWSYLGMSRGDRRRASPLSHIGAHPSSLLLLHSPADEVVPLDQSRRLADALPTAKLIRLAGRHLEDRAAMRIGLRWLAHRVPDETPA